MPISGALLTKVNNALADLANRIENREAIFFANNGRYWQGLLTPRIIPVDGADTAPDLDAKPSNETFDWSAANLPATIPVGIAVNAHDGPLGQGFTMIAWVKLGNGEIWYRSKGVGAYGVTTVGWDQVPAD